MDKRLTWFKANSIQGQKLITGQFDSGPKYDWVILFLCHGLGCPFSSSKKGWERTKHGLWNTGLDFLMQASEGHDLIQGHNLEVAILLDMNGY